MRNLFHLAWRAMGCEVSVQLETDADGRALLSDIPAQVEAIEAVLSRFRPESELMRLNANAGRWVNVSEVLFANISAAKHGARLTDGMYNPLILPAMIANGYDKTFAELATAAEVAPIPAEDWQLIDLRPKSREVRLPANSAIDLGGIAKGWTAAHTAEKLAAYGACLVNFGGDLVARGAPKELPGWEVTITDPFDQTEMLTVWLRDASLVTSGIDFRHWHAQDGTTRNHIIDPRTGRSVNTDVVSVTVHHPEATTAEAYAKSVLLRGAQDGLNWLQSQWDAAGILVCHDHTVVATPQFLHHIEKDAQ